MKKLLLAVGFQLLFAICFGQVKIGYNPTTVNPAAVLELSNNTAAAPSTWKSFIPPRVDFSAAVFTNTFVWGIAGPPTEGALVYNISETYNNGFSGPGLYCWQRNSWAFVSLQVTDKIRMALSTSVAMYDAATVNSWVNITAAEYNNLLLVVSGAAKYATPDIYMNTNAGEGWTFNYTIGGSENQAKVPASNYIIAWALRTGIGTSSSSGSKLKISTSKNSGYIDYGNALPNIGTIAANSRVYFALKTPNLVTPASACYTGLYNATTYFLGNNTSAGAGPEFYIQGDSASPSTSITTDSYSQVISTVVRQW